MNFRLLDLNLLRVLAAIYRTRSVTAAGKALSLSQPATSNALARLRDFFGDELFVRASAGLAPTHLCERIAPKVLAQLRTLESVVTGREHFDPASSEVLWRVSLSDLGEMMFLPALTAALRLQAPRARLTNTAVAAAGVAPALDAREIDFAIGILQSRHRGLRAEPLFRENYVAMTSAAWRPASGRAGRTLSTAQLAQAALVVAAPTATFQDRVERMLTQMDLNDRIAVRVGHFGALPEIALNTDLLAIVPEMYAANLRKRHDLRIWDLPQKASAAYEVRMVWHASTAQDPAQQWIRTLVRSLFTRPAAASAAPEKTPGK